MIIFFGLMFFVVISVAILWTHAIDKENISKKERDDIEFP